MKKFNIWQSDTTGSCLLPADKDPSLMFEEDEEYRIVHSFFAKTLLEANQQYYDYYDFGEYKPVCYETTGLPLKEYFIEYD